MINFLKKKNNVKKIIILSVFLFVILLSVAPLGAEATQWGVTGSVNQTVYTPPDNSTTDLNFFQNGIFRLLGYVAAFGLKLSSYLIGISGWILNKVVEISIVNMAEYTDEAFVKSSWVIIRDLLNIFFIFGLLYISIKTIISSWSSDTRKMLSRIIMAALLINFSFFFTSLMIDVSNVVTLNVYRNMKGCYSDEGKTTTLSNCWIDQMKLTTIYKVRDDPGVVNKIQTLKDSNLIGFVQATFLGSIVLSLAGIIFFGISVALLARFITLIFILITSPVMFAGWILPNFSSITKKWADKLQSNLVFAPVVFIFLYISYQMISSGNLLVNSEGGFSSALSNPSADPNTGNLGIIINFIIIIGFLVGSLVAAKTVGDSAASAGSNFAGKWVGKGANKLIGGVGRQTIGRGATRIADNISDTGRFSRALKSNLNKVGDASFDARNTAAFKGVASKTGITFGDGQKGGYVTSRDANRKAIEEAHKRAGEMTLKEKEERDRIKIAMKAEYKDEMATIKKSQEKVSELKDEQKQYNKDDEEYKKIENIIQNEYKIINENRKTIKYDTKNKDGNRNDDIKTLEKSGKKRQEEFIKKVDSKINNFFGKSNRQAVANLRSKEKDEIKEIISKENKKEDKKEDTDDKKDDK